MPNYSYVICYWEGFSNGSAQLQDLVGVYDDEEKFKKDFFKICLWREDQSSEEEQLFRSYPLRDILSDFDIWFDEYSSIEAHAGYTYYKMLRNEITL